MKAADLLCRPRLPGLAVKETTSSRALSVVGQLASVVRRRRPAGRSGTRGRVPRARTAVSPSTLPRRTGRTSRTLHSTPAGTCRALRAETSVAGDVGAARARRPSRRASRPPRYDACCPSSPLPATAHLERQQRTTYVSRTRALRMLCGDAGARIRSAVRRRSTPQLAALLARPFPSLSPRACLLPSTPTPTYLCPRLPSPLSSRRASSLTLPILEESSPANAGMSRDAKPADRPQQQQQQQPEPADQPPSTSPPTQLCASPLSTTSALPDGTDRPADADGERKEGAPPIDAGDGADDDEKQREKRLRRAARHKRRPSSQHRCGPSLPLRTISVLGS